MIHLPRIFALVREFWPRVRLWKFAENVASSYPHDVIEVTQLLEVSPPVDINAGDVAWVNRPRLYWSGWDVVQNDAVTEVDEGDRRRLRFDVDRGPCTRWLDSGCSWVGELEGRPLPTFIRHVPKNKPPRDPRGFHRASDEAKARWAQSRWAVICPHFETKNMITGRDGQPRLPSVQEREKLHYMRRHHTLGGMRSSQAKSSPKEEFAVRCQMVGDGYHHVVVAWLLGQLFAHVGYLSSRPTMAQILSRRVREVHVSRTAEFREAQVLSGNMALAERLHRWLLARVDGRGSDVRICSGELVQPNRVTRQSSKADWWTWRTTMAWTWQRQGSHINELESLAILAELKARTRNAKNFSMAYVHLVDSQVALGIFTKRRTSSRLLQRVIRRANCICLSANLLPVFLYVRSELNPADAPSRGQNRKPCRNE